LSLFDMSWNESLLIAASYFWSDAINVVGVLTSVAASQQQIHKHTSCPQAPVPPSQKLLKHLS
jgi:hypothetical protein